MVPTATLKKGMKMMRVNKQPSVLALLRPTRITIIVRKGVEMMMRMMTMKTVTQRTATRTSKSKTITQRRQIQQAKYL